MVSKFEVKGGLSILYLMARNVALLRKLLLEQNSVHKHGMSNWDVLHYFDLSAATDCFLLSFLAMKIKYKGCLAGNAFTQISIASCALETRLKAASRIALAISYGNPR